LRIDAFFSRLQLAATLRTSCNSEDPAVKFLELR
jgi:hypothetical protein